ncbi:MAG: hypothetical protein ACPG7F_10970 [Aggregatilineales bacterium]
MKKYYIKALIQGILPVLPASHRSNYVFQRHVSQGLHFTDA